MVISLSFHLHPLWTCLFFTYMCIGVSPHIMNVSRYFEKVPRSYWNDYRYVCDAVITTPHHLLVCCQSPLLSLTSYLLHVCIFISCNDHTAASYVRKCGAITKEMGTRINQSEEVIFKQSTRATRCVRNGEQRGGKYEIDRLLKDDF